MIKRSAFAVLLLAAPLFLGGCTTTAVSNPPRTATEELLISTAAEHAARKLTLQIPPKAKVFVENGNFEGTDSKYAIGTIRTVLLQQGVHLVDDKKTADVVVETRAGALSTDRNNFLIGIPQFDIPVPFASSPVSFPQIALYASDDQKGVAKFAVTGYDAKHGTLVDAQDPQYGYSHNIKKTVLIFISWTENDALPDSEDDNKDSPDKASVQAPLPNAPQASGGPALPLAPPP